MTLLERLRWLVTSGALGGFSEPHPNQGLAGGMLPWVLMPKPEGQPAKLCYDDAQLEAAISKLETHGPWGLGAMIP